MRGFLCFLKRNVFVALAALPLTLADVALAEPVVLAETVEAKNEKQQLIREVLTASGLLPIVEAAASIRDKEMTKLAATKGPISQQELSAVKARLMASVRERYMIGQLQGHLGKEFSVSDLQKVLQKLKAPAIEKAKLIKRRVREASFEEEIRDYHLRLIERPPRESRVQLMRQLAKVERINDLNTMVQVEVRKSLLTAITHVKDNMIPSEQELDRQMTSFRKRVSDQSSDKSVEHYLYLFRSVPSSELKEMINDYQQSGFQKVVDSYKKRLKKEFSVGRQQFDQASQISGSALAKRT